MHLVGVAEPGAGRAVRFLPGRLVVLQPGAERRVFLAAARQHGDEPAAAAVDVAHRLRGGKLAVSDVEEIAAAGQLDQRIPCRDVGGVVAGAAVRQPEGHRHGVICGHGQDEHQLLQVRPVILGVTPGDRRRGDAVHVLPAGVLVGAVHADRGGVVVQPRAVDAELADHAGHQLGEQAAPVRAEQPVQHPAGPVIVQQGRLAVAQAQQGRLVGLRPLAQGIQRPVLGAQVRHDDRQDDRRVQRQARVIGRHPVPSRAPSPVRAAKWLIRGSAPSRRVASVNPGAAAAGGFGVSMGTSLTADPG